MFDAGYEYLADPDVAISMGIGPGTATRGVNDVNVIESVVVTASRRPPLLIYIHFEVFEVFSVITGYGASDLGGGGPAYTPAPDPDPNKDQESINPCSNMKNKMGNSGFTNMMNGLGTLLSERYESGYEYSYSNGQYSFLPHTGAPGDHRIDWNPTPSHKIDGFIHTHVEGGLPIFSASDLLIPGEWDRIGGLNDLSRFSFGVITSSGTYFLLITDMSQYRAFYNQTGLNSLESLYKFYGITTNTSATDAVAKLALMLAQLNSGLSLMKKDGNKFNQLNVDSKNNVITLNC